MSILDLNGAAPLPDYKSRRALAVVPKKRTLGDPGTVPSALLSGGGKGGAFLAARLDRLTGDFPGTRRSADADLQGANGTMRARGRELAINSPFGRKFLAMLSQNIVGPQGILLQSKVTGLNGKQTATSKLINRRIEEEWKRWGRRGSCTADGRFSWLQLQHLAIKNCGREGENLVKDVYGKQFNRSGYAVQILDNDQLDDDLMQNVEGGNQIRMGVEVDGYLRPQAYYLFDGHPKDPLSRGRTRKRIPADLVTHTALFERPGQTRGYTWMAAAMLPAHNLNQYENSVIIASRQAADKAFAIESEAAEGFDFDDEDVDQQVEAADAYTSEAGSGWRLPPGEKLTFFDPRFPSPNHKQFMQAMLRSIATGLLVDYPTLANDLEGVNFSSIRAGMLDTRDCYRILQAWFIESFCQPLFDKWLRMALLTTLSDIAPLMNEQQMEQITWKPRGWDWVDPLKDAQAIVLKLQNGLITYADALASLGLDFEETMTERAMEQAFLDALGITLGTDITGVADAPEDGDDSDDKDTGDSKDTGKSKPKRSRVQFPTVERAAEIANASELLRALRSYEPPAPAKEKTQV